MTREREFSYPRRQGRIVVAGGDGSGDTTSSSSGCPCVCIDTGDIVVNGIVTTSQWSITMANEPFKGAFGTIVFPAGVYVVVWDTEAEKWTLDIGDTLTATYNDGSDATADTTMDGTLNMEFDSYGMPVVTVCVDGAVPDPGA